VGKEILTGGRRRRALGLAGDSSWTPRSLMLCSMDWAIHNASSLCSFGRARYFANAASPLAFAVYISLAAKWGYL
jgi:hypothetical protein